MTDDYFVVRGDTPKDAIEKLKAYEKENLVQLIFNNRLNSFVSRYADEEETKLVPYIGWYWRSTDFFNGRISIGDCGEFIGVMENNKWDYPERLLSKEEAEKVTSIVWEAKKLSEQGGLLSEIHANTKDKLRELWDLFQTFKVEREDPELLKGGDSEN